MTRLYVVEPLASAHNRRRFTSGVEALDCYFREQVSQDIRQRLSNCFVAIDTAGKIAAYYTFFASSLPMTDLSPDEAKRLPHYPLLSAGLIGRLAVATQCRGQRLGAALILDAAARAEPAIFALIVDARDDKAGRFDRNLGSRPLASRPSSLYWPMAAAAFRMNDARVRATSDARSS